MEAKEKKVVSEHEETEPDIVDLKDAVYSEIPVKRISPNKYNCNVMTKEDYKALKSDMKSSGPEGMSPIIVRRLDKGYEIIDGEHRWRAAKELKWEEIGATIFLKEDISEDEALLLNFKINRQRGTHDPFKEAAFLKHLTEDNGLSQKKAAALLNIDRSTVSKRLSILGLDRKILEDVPDGTPTPTSVLEVVAQGPTKEDQAELLEEYYDGETVQDLEWSLKRMKADYEKEQAFKKDYEGFKHPSCPNCNEPADRWCYDKKYVICENHHRWSPKTGRTPESYSKTSSTESGSSTSSPAMKPEKKITRIFRSMHTEDEVHAAVRKTLKKALAAFVDQCDHVELRTGGPYAWNGARIVFTNSHVSTSITFPADQGHLELWIEPKSYKDGNKLKVEVRSPSPTLRDGPKKGQELFEQMMKNLLTYGQKDKKKSKKGRGKKNA